MSATSAEAFTINWKSCPNGPLKHLKRKTTKGNSDLAADLSLKESAPQAVTLKLLLSAIWISNIASAA
ncbi:hypothetical protein ADUPG1_001619 [Aduncisulcus paluster]|uniref:Uncharacterized protein n=1 Tax=Aduncisulcus paluster TaxID=2918883 RepID=A0ABQ5KDM5_9EUKA|nr:hypothetical protein ADUPG1_001619 [Aduncisulcus paluster]